MADSRDNRRLAESLARLRNFFIKSRQVGHPPEAVCVSFSLSCFA